MIDLRPRLQLGSHGRVGIGTVNCHHDLALLHCIANAHGKRGNASRHWKRDVGHTIRVQFHLAWRNYLISRHGLFHNSLNLNLFQLRRIGGERNKTRNFHGDNRHFSDCFGAL